MLFIDIHARPNYKSFARAHNSDGSIVSMGSDPKDKSSLWHYDSPSLLDKAAQLILSVTKFSQSNGTAAHYGHVGVIVMALGSVEQPFFKNKLGTSFITDLIDDFAAGFGRARINAIEGMSSYWKDLQKEIEFIKSGDSVVVEIDGLFHTYKIAKSFADLAHQQQQNNLPDVGAKSSNPHILSIVLSIEGMHVLNDNIGEPLKEEDVLQNVRELKDMDPRPWFLNFSHHFDNHLCGHARSLRSRIGKATNQEDNINAPFNELGKKVLHLLVDNSDGKRLFIDIKHMSIEGRKYYRSWRKQNADTEIPLIISHGVCNGLPNYAASESDFPDLGKYFINALEDVKGGDGTYKEHNSINFYDDEIIEVVTSNGIMGLQLDERRLANAAGIGRVKHSVKRHKIMHYRSELVWNQLLYMASMLDANGLFAWGHVAIGSDYDGIVDPLNSFWTMEQYDSLAQYVERHAYTFFKENPNSFKHPFNNMTADEVVERLFHNNAWAFFKRWY